MDDLCITLYCFLHDMTEIVPFVVFSSTGNRVFFFAMKRNLAVKVNVALAMIRPLLHWQYYIYFINIYGAQDTDDRRYQLRRCIVVRSDWNGVRSQR